MRDSRKGFVRIARIRLRRKIANALNAQSAVAALFVAITQNTRLRAFAFIAPSQQDLERLVASVV
jgi:hypothetical protein